MTDTGGRSGCRGEGEGAVMLGGRSLRGCRLVRCAGCGLPTARCLCATFPRLHSRVRVVMVMHRVEALRSSNTGRLVAGMLEGASVRVRGGRDDLPAETPGARVLVLFPREGARPLERADAGEDLTLVVPDGTWAQARRIARRDDLARDAEAVCLPDRASAYGLRRNPRPGALCTLEAVAEALRVLEGDALAEPLLEAFARWRDATLALRAGA